MVVASLALTLCTVIVDVPVHRHDLAFQLQVPDGWGVVHDDFEVAHYRRVLVALNNLGDPNLRVDDWEHEGGSTYGRHVVGRQLPAGAVYVDIAISEGPPSGNLSYRLLPEDGPGSRIALLVAERKPAWEESDAVGYGVGFARWGLPWSAVIYAAKPVDDVALSQAMVILQSLTFPDTPVTDAAQAVEIAVSHLPMEYRPLPDETPCGPPTYDVTVEASSVGYLVTFTVFAGAGAHRRVATCEVTVDGHVTLRDLRTE